MHIQCEKQLLKKFCNQQPKNELLVKDRYSAILGSWYASTINILQNDFLLIVHNKSLFSAVDLLDLTSEHSFDQVFINLRGKILDMLQDYYFLSDNQVADLVRPFGVITFGDVEDPHLTRVVQIIAKSYEKKFLQAKQKSKNGEIRLWELEESLNKSPHRSLGGSSPLEIIRELVWSGVN